MVILLATACGTFRIETEPSTAKSEPTATTDDLLAAVATPTDQEAEATVIIADVAPTRTDETSTGESSDSSQIDQGVTSTPSDWRLFKNSEFGISLWHPPGTSIRLIDASTPTYCGPGGLECIAEEQLFSAVVIQEAGDQQSVVEFKVVNNPEEKSTAEMAEMFSQRCPGSLTSPLEATTLSVELAGYRYSCEGMMTFVEFWAPFGDRSDRLLGAAWAESAAPLSEEILMTLSITQQEEMLTYENSEYGFSLRYPATWNVEELLLIGGEPDSHSLQFGRGSTKLIIGYRRTGESATVAPSGVPAGDLVERGTTRILGFDVPRQVLVFEGKDKAVYYGAPEIPIATIGLEFSPSLQEFAKVDFPEIDLSKSVQADADNIIRSLAISGQATPGEGTSGGYNYAGWNSYTNEALGYSLMYPGDTEVQGANRDEMVEFVGPIINADHWPWFFVEHFDSDFFSPPLGTDVKQWLADSNIPYEPTDQELTIGGLPAVRYLFEASPQAYARDDYYVIKDDQLFLISILHADGLQDWALYEQFLASIAFQ
jgi:hypothetical protein